jgi:hypothetical protein
MKSYSNHLITTQSFGESIPLNYRPTMRSSAAFPIRIENKKIDSVITFMGYWLLKREIKEVTAIITIRSSSGETINVESNLINCVKSYSWSLSEILKKRLKNFNGDFFGSVEIEIFSARDMVFPYPAITLSYMSKLGNTFVHTCGRIYNDVSDMEVNNEQVVPETGFDIIPNEELSPYFSFVNGPQSINNETIVLEFINNEGESLSINKKIHNKNPYSTVWINVLEDKKAKSFFKGKRGTIKIHHNFVGFFPRFVAGNVYKNFEAISLTHTFYDTSEDLSDSAVWKNSNTKEFFDSTISFPISFNYDFTELVIYPNLVTNKCRISFEFYNEDGYKVGKSAFTDLIADSQKSVKYINCQKLLEDITSEKKLHLCKVLFDGNGKVPTRMKFGLNIGKNSGANLPSNICFNAKVPNPKILNKPKSFKWCTVFDSMHQSIFITNSSFLRNNQPKAEIEASFWREEDDQCLQLNFRLPADGVIDIMNGHRDEISNFLNGSIGWVSMLSSSPHTGGFYVTNFNKGVIGADHIY